MASPGAKSMKSSSPTLSPKSGRSSDPSPSSSSSIRISSPLNPNTTPKNATFPLPDSSDGSNTPPTSGQFRGRTISSSTEPPSSALKSPVMVVPSASEGTGSTHSLPDYKMLSTFRSRDRSRSPIRDNGDQLEAEHRSLASSWWGERHVSDSWQEVPKKRKVLPAEHAEALESTRKRVARATVSVLGTAADVVHEALTVGVDLLDLAPIPGLAVAAKTLLNIWDACQMVDMNFLGSLRLTERCADILLSVREEVHQAGDEVGEELAAPIEKLEQSFTFIHAFLLKQTHRPFLKRYLKRDEILRDIHTCDSTLRDALALFSISIQVRILKQVQDNERRRHTETQAALQAILSGRLPLPPSVDPELLTTIQTSGGGDAASHPLNRILENNYSSETVTRFSTTTNALGLIDTPASPQSTIDHSDVLPALQNLHSMQNSLDAARDLADLRQLMRDALQTSSDAQMVEVLQIGRQEMPDAIKTLQRALEKISEREADGVSEAMPPKGVVMGRIVRQFSTRGESDSDSGGRNPKRSKTMVSFESSSSSGGSGGGSLEQRRRDTLDFEFIETGIDALRRMSRGTETTVPSWTITKYEIDREDKIGIGFFSDVYKGKWRGHVVAIKVLAESTPRKLFLREIAIWKTLRHANVLPLYGASSASGDPPWFFVSPYLKHGSLVEYLKRVEQEDRPAGLGLGGQSPRLPHRGSSPRNGTFSSSSPRKDPSLLPPTPQGSLTPRDRDAISNANANSNANNEPVDRKWDLFRFMHEVAKGMAYLHNRGVLHGDLKAANVLVNDRYQCMISDFGQSEMKSEAFRISGSPIPHGTLRWQSPELMSGQSQLTTEIDVWAFSILCVEILTMGRVPWPLMDDEAVRRFVTQDNTRPPLPQNSRFNTPGLQVILKLCWHTDPAQRPPFSKIVRDLKFLRKATTGHVGESPRISVIDEVPEHTTSPSPDMRPHDLPPFLRGVGAPPQDILVGSLAAGITQSATNAGVGAHRESTVSTDDVKMPEPVIYTPGPSSRASSIALPHPEDQVFLGFDSFEVEPSPPDERTANTQNERRYRFLLTHDFHPSLTLPLWTPSPIELGDIGYLSKPDGEFITLFNAFRPLKSNNSLIQGLPSIHGYGRAETGSQRRDRRTVTQRGIDTIAGWITFGNSTSQNVSRRYEFPLKAGHKASYLCTETTDYRYFVTLDASKKWFKAQIDTILKAYGDHHHLQREDIFLVIGTLRTPNYGLFVSHRHPEGHAHFNVYSTPKNGRPWGTFTTDTEVASELGPMYDDEASDSTTVTASKVSNHGGPWDAILLARLRFKPDAQDPTSK